VHWNRPRGERNFLVEGVSSTGKTTVCAELRRRGHHAINGDTEPAYQGDRAILIDGTAAIDDVVDDILRRALEPGSES